MDGPGAENLAHWADKVPKKADRMIPTSFSLIPGSTLLGAEAHPKCSALMPKTQGYIE
jgi:hypothetical protein